MYKYRKPEDEIDSLDTSSSDSESTKSERGESQEFNAVDWAKKRAMRINILAKPRKPRKKWVSRYGPIKLIQKSIEIDSEILHRCDQLAVAPLRTIRQNRKFFRPVLSEKKIENFEVYEEKIMESSYFLYRKYHMIKERLKWKKQQRKIAQSKSSRKLYVEPPEERAIRLERLAQPKKEIEEKVDRGKRKPIGEMRRLIKLALPLERYKYPPENIGGVSANAKNYKPTDTILKLAQQPARYEFLEPPLQPDRPVARSALTYKLTPRLEQLYVVKIRKDAPTPDVDKDGWIISPNALKYVATPRILELALPRKRP